jgi:hypothetical protein
MIWRTIYRSFNIYALGIKRKGMRNRALFSVCNLLILLQIKIYYKYAYFYNIYRYDVYIGVHFEARNDWRMKMNNLKDATKIYRGQDRAAAAGVKGLMWTVATLRHSSAD